MIFSIFMEHCMPLVLIKSARRSMSNLRFSDLHQVGSGELENIFRGKS